jgi:hypothetical protein
VMQLCFDFWCDECRTLGFTVYQRDGWMTILTITPCSKGCSIPPKGKSLLHNL